jgi:DNA-directed RNA polymerase subunit K/omega
MQPAATPRRSVPFVTRFERTAMLGVRMQQLAGGAPTTLSDDEQRGLSTPDEVARRELDLGKMPFLLQRKLPDGTQEVLRPSDLRGLTGAAPLPGQQS